MTTNPVTVRLRVEIDVDADAYRALYGIDPHVDVAGEVRDHVVELLETSRAASVWTPRTVRPVKR